MDVHAQTHSPRKKWDELSTLIAISGQTAQAYRRVNLVKQFDIAQRLIPLIKKEYHLE